MKKLIHRAGRKQPEYVDMTPAEIAAHQQMQSDSAAREALPKPGEDMLALVESARTVGELRAAIAELVRRMYNLPAPVVEEPVEVEAQGVKG
jgi:hypothetical protein